MTPEIPGVAELRTMCANARRVADLCELLSLEGGFLEARRRVHQLEQLPSGAAADEVTFVREYDPDVDPYIWELDQCRP